MKNKIAKILGLALTLATLTSAVVFASPVSAFVPPNWPASVSWSKIAMPSSTGNVLASARDLGPIAQAADGSVIFMGAGNGWNQKLYKSIDFGRTWSSVDAFPNDPMYTGQMFDIAFGSSPSIVYVTDGINIYKTSNGGATWTTIAGLFNSPLVFPGGHPGYTDYITSLSVGYLAGAPYIFASTSTFGFVGTGGAYVCQEAAYASPWSNLNVGTDRPENTSTLLDCLRIQVMPDFGTTQGIILVWSDYANHQTRVSAKYGGAHWDAVANDVRLTYSSGTSLLNVSETLITANIFLATDFSSNPATGLMQAFVGVDSFNPASPQADVFLCYFAPATSGAESSSFDLNIAGTDTGTNISDMSGVGTAAGASIMVSGSVPSAATPPMQQAVFTTRNGGQTWTAAAKLPSFGVGSFGYSPLYPAFLSVVVLKNDFATSGQALIATQGYDNAVSFTADFGSTFNAISFVHTYTMGLVFDTLTDISVASDGTIYAAANDGTRYSLWRRDIIGWERILESSLISFGANPNRVFTLPDNSALFFGDSVSGTIYRSLDKGKTFRQELSLNPGAGFGAWLAVNANTLLVGDTATGLVYQTTTNGVVWFTRAAFTGSQTVSDIRVASNGDYLAAGYAGGVAYVSKSSDGGLTWTAFTTDFTAAGATAVYITPAADYATGGRVFLGTAGAGLGVYYNTATGTTWTRADGTPGAPVSTVLEVQNNNTTGIVATAGGPGNSSEGSGMVYATNTASNTGVLRIKGSAKLAEPLTAPSGVTFSGLWLSSNSVGNVTLFTVSGNTIYFYNDTLNQAGAGVAVSAITATSARVSWTAMANATAYFVVASPTAFTSIYATALPSGASSVILSGTPLPTTYAFAPLAPATTYFVSVWALAPVSSFMFGGATTFTTLPTMPVPVTAGLIPYPGQQNVQPLVNFQWQTVANATSYELWLDTKVDFSTAQKYSVAAPAGGALNVDWAPPAALAYNTLYYWQVRAVTAAGTSVWNGVWSFTTMAAPIPPVTVSVAPVPTIIFPTQAPPVTITRQAPAPVPTITIPLTVTQLPAPPVATPTYIWVIVGVGGILAIAVIILIIRTR